MFLNTVRSLLIIGGDRRQIYTGEQLERLGFEVEIYAPAGSGLKKSDDLRKSIVDCDAVIFPLPLSSDGITVKSDAGCKESIDEIISMLTGEKIVFGGKISRSIELRLKSKGIKFFDYYESEEVILMNIVPTVQGILKTVFENIDYTVHSSRIAVFGYGRIGKYCSEVFSSLGGNVTVCTRKPGDIALAKINGKSACRITDFADCAADTDILINTVPSQIIDENIISRLKKSSIIIDVASAPYGTDFTAAEKHGIKALLCPSLPAKVAPVTAGKIIANGIYNILTGDNYA